MDALEQARALLKDCTPLKADCGKICGHACCKADETGENGMLLFPFEERYYTDDSDFVITGERIICRGGCKRENRPLGCRVFPLVMLEDGKVKMDIRAWPVCPLMQSGIKGLQADFVLKVQEAAKLLWADEKHRAFMIKTAAIIKQYKEMI
jgi:hypothetical protein